MSPRKVQDIIIPRPGSKIPQRVSGEGGVLARTASSFKLASAGSRAGKAPPHPPSRRENGSSSGRRFPRAALIGSALFAVAVLIFAFSTFFEKATVRVAQKEEIASFDSIIVARRGDTETAQSIIPFEIMELRETVSKEVKATALEPVERRASGKIVVYNDYSKQSQRLIKNTRFESSDGKIYRIYESVVVPGQKVVDGKTMPGQIEVVIHADEPGPTYNKSLSDFTIPGFKGTPQYAKFYARSTTELAGGFLGNVKTVAASELVRVRAELHEEAKQKLLASAQAQKPEDFVLFSDAVFVLFPKEEPLPEEPRENGMANITEEAVLYGILFDSKKFSEFLTEKLSYDADGGAIAVRNLDGLDFKIIDKTNFDPEKDTQFSFMLKGKPQLVWKFDEEKLRNELRAMPKRELASILIGFPGITRAEVTFRPFWMRSFPDTEEKILIEEMPNEK